MVFTCLGHLCLLECVGLPHRRDHRTKWIIFGTCCRAGQACQASRVHFVRVVRTNNRWWTFFGPGAPVSELLLRLANGATRVHFACVVRTNNCWWTFSGPGPSVSELLLRFANGATRVHFARVVRTNNRWWTFSGPGLLVSESLLRFANGATRVHFTCVVRTNNRWWSCLDPRCQTDFFISLTEHQESMFEQIITGGCSSEGSTNHFVLA